MELDIHKNIYDKLKYFIEIKKIPNLIFHGPSGSGKRKLVNIFIKMVYDNDKELIKSYVMYVNCAHGKGIKFIREELKFFAKTYINNGYFKSIILSNADKLTIDGQSALRRCIELFSHSTRFFIIVEDKYKLLKPILSRFCEIYIPEPEYNGKIINLYKYNLEETFKLTDIKNQKNDWLKKEIQKTINENMDNIDLQGFVTKLYEKAYNALDIIKLIEDGCFNLTEEKRYELLLAFNKIRKEIRSEKLLLMFIINFTFLDKKTVLENMTFI